VTGTGLSHDRHLSQESFERCLLSDAPLDYPIEGEPPVSLIIDPTHKEIGLRVLTHAGEQPEETGRENLFVRAVLRDDKHYVEILVNDPRLFASAYPILMTIADEIQLGDRAVGDAIAATIRMFDQVLQRENGLSLERELGLYGELLTLRDLCFATRVPDALAAWQSENAEQHDFSLAALDIEVKATSTERRQHWIGSLTQLNPTGDRPLWLASHQLTRTGGGGQSLPDLIDELRNRIGSGAARDPFERKLRAAGWMDLYAKTVRSRWLLRSPSVVYEVGPGFPRLTRPLLSQAKIPMQVIEVRYRIDLDGQAAAGSFAEALTPRLKN
jgi:hypothetical protein